MSYVLEIAEAAKRDRDRSFRWYEENYSKQFADTWYQGIAQAILSLRDNPERCGFAHENEWLSEECRQLLYRTTKKYRHRIIFRIHGGTVSILRIRHSSQGDLRQEDMPD